jgi:hypothetical protein
MNRVERECRETDSDVLGSCRVGGAIADPLAAPDGDGLPGCDIDRAVAMLDAQASRQHEREFVELRSLTGFDPSAGTSHAGDAHLGIAGIHPADKFIDEFGLVACRFDSRRLWYQRGHWDVMLSQVVDRIAKVARC